MWKINLLFIVVISVTAHAGVLNPECTVDKAVKSAVTNATVGIGGRCSLKEAATDTVKITAKEALPDEGTAGKVVDLATPNKEPQTIRNTTQKIVN